MKKNICPLKKHFIIIFLLLFILDGCQFVNPLEPQDIKTSTQKNIDNNKTDKTDLFDIPSGYQLDKMIILSRHNIRSPLNNSELEQLTTHKLMKWSTEDGYLTSKGGINETLMGQFFREYAIKNKLLPKNSADNTNNIYIYANSRQRTIASAKYFSTGFLPMSNNDVIYKSKFDTMDPVFNPVLTKCSKKFDKQVQNEIANSSETKKIETYSLQIKESLSLLEKVLDYKNCDYAKKNHTQHLCMNDTKVKLQKGKEPSLEGDLSIANRAVNMLILQYYENTNSKAASLNNELSTLDWKKLGKIKDLYQKILFGSSHSIAINVANPLLKELKNEFYNSAHKFTYLCGHDSNIDSVLTALNALEYETTNSIAQKTPIGCKLVFEQLKNKKGKKYIKILLVYQDTNQLRSTEELNLENPPCVEQIYLENTKQNEDDLYSFDDIDKRIKKAIDEYNKLP